MWLAIFQQKEYRLDRVTAFLKTTEGQTNLFKLAPKPRQLNRKSLKRPKKTLRILLLSLISGGLIFLPSLWLLAWQPLVFLLLCFSILLLIPVIVFLSNLPLTLFKNLAASFLLFLARKKVRSTSPIIIGITGSYGKTTTKHLLSHVLSSKNEVFTTKRSFNTPLSLAVDILRRYKSEEMMVLEYAAYKPGEIKRLAKIFRPQTAIITGFAPQHLATFGSKEGIVRAKAELILALPAQSKVFFNQSSRGVRKIIEHAALRTGQKSHIYIPFKAADESSKYSDIQLDKRGRLIFKLGETLVKTKLVGEQYLSAVQAAVAVAKDMKMSEKQIARALSSFEPGENYIKFFRHKQGFWVIDDGRTSNPAGFKAALKLLAQMLQKRQLTGKKVLFTAGIIDLGDESQAVHLDLAKRAKETVSIVVYLGESGKKQFRQIFGDKLLINKNEIESLLSSLSVNDLVLVEGRLPIWLADFLEVRQ